MADASAGGEGSQERLEGWSERLQRQAGVALTREQKAAMNAQRLIDSAKQQDLEREVAKGRAEAQARKRSKSKN